MYNEEERPRPFRSVLLKIALIVLLLFILMILFPTKGFISNYIDSKMGRNDNTFNSNIIAMATAGSGYYNETRLPKNTGEKSRMTLEEMYDQKMIVKFTDKNGAQCSKKKSYVEVTKEENEYTMKVNLSCTSKSDYIMLHMPLDGKQFPSTSTARCKFVKNLDEAWTYGEWSDWGTDEIVEDSTKQVETTTKKIQTGTRNVIKLQEEKAPANKFIYNGQRVYYVCAKKYDNAGTYDYPTTCKRTMQVHTTIPTYKEVTYYRWRSKTPNEKKQDIKEAQCDDESLINEGYTKIGEVKTANKVTKVKKGETM